MPAAKFLIVPLVVLCCGSAVAQKRRAQPSGTFQEYAAQADEAASQDHLEDAIRLYRRALGLKPSWKQGWWKLGTSLYDQNRYREAGAAFARTVVLDPSNGTAHMFLGLCKDELGEYDDALKNLEEARRLGVLDNQQLRNVLLYHLSVLLLRKGGFESAMEPLNALVRGGGAGQDVELALGMAMLRMRPAELPPEGSARRAVVLQIGKAEELGKTNFDAARQDWQQIVTANPVYPNIHYAFGRFLLELHDIDAAVVEFKREIKNQPDHVMARLQIAAVRYRVDSAAGVPFAEEAVRLNPNYPFAHYLLGLLYADSGAAEKAVPQLEAARKAFADEPAVYFALGNVYAKLGRKQDAARARATFARLNAARRAQPGQTTYGEKTPGIAQQALGESSHTHP